MRDAPGQVSNGGAQLDAALARRAMIATDEQLMLLGAVVLGIFYAVAATDYAHTQWWTASLLLAGVLVGAAVVVGARLAPWFTLTYAVAVGAADRIVRAPFVGSDVLTATKEAVAVLVQGKNPYAYSYHSNGALVPYPPGELLFYTIPHLLVGRIDTTDRWMGVGILLLLAVLAPIVGPTRAALATALYATFTYAAFRSTDGSNDTSFSFFLVLAVVLLAWSERSRRAGRALFIASAVAFAWALLFKQFAVLFYPFILVYLWRRGAAWRRYASVSLGVAVLVALPFFLTAPAGFIHNILGIFVFPREVWGLNVWAGLHGLAPGFVDTVSPAITPLSFPVVIFAGVALIVRPAPDLGRALFQGLALMVTALFLARWTTSVYYTGAAAVLATAVALIDVPVRQGAWSPAGPRREANGSWPNWPLLGRPPWHRPATKGSAAQASAAPPRRGTRSLPMPRPQAWVDRVVGRLTWVEGTLGVAVIGCALRFADLAGVPPSLNQDEAVNGYDAYSLLLTGRDHLGHPFPFAGLESFGDWVSPLLTFLTVPAVGLFGLRVEVLRAVSGLIGLVAVVVVYRLAIELFGRRSIGLVAATLVAVLPWPVYLSRWAIPPTLVPTMTALTMLTLLWAVRRRSSRGIVAAALVAGLTVASYPTMKLYVPLLVLAIVAVFWRGFVRIKREALAYAAVVLLIVAGPILYLSTIDAGGRARLEQVSVFRAAGVGPVFLLKQYLSYFSPNFLFRAGDGDPMHMPPGFGLFPWAMLPLLAAGCVWLVMRAARPRAPRERQAALVLLIALVCYPIAGSLTVPNPHTLRAVHLIPLAALVAAAGAMALVDLARRLVANAQPAVRTALVVLAVLPLPLVLGVEAVQQYHNYFGAYANEVMPEFQYGLPQALAYARAHEAEYDEIWVTGANQPYIYVLFTAKWSPNDVHQHLPVVRNPPQFNVVPSFHKYRFGDPSDVQADRLTRLATITYPRGGIAYALLGGTMANGTRTLVIVHPQS